MRFREGERVRFKGLKAGKLTLKPVTGILRKADGNTSIKGVTQIIGDTQRMLFSPDGSIYCHAHFGVMLERKELPIQTKKKIRNRK